MMIELGLIAAVGGKVGAESPRAAAAFGAVQSISERVARPTSKISKQPSSLSILG
jgi:hypothetical protein